MSAITGGWVLRLASAGAGLALLGAALDPASAASSGGSCCADLEERVAELEATTARKGTRKVDLKISGAVSTALLFWDDGREQNTYVVTNAKDATTFVFEGEVEFAKGWKAGYTIGIDAIFGGSDLVDQNTDEPGKFLDLADSFFFIANDRLGTVRVGQNDSGTDKIDNVNLAEVDLAADSVPQDWNASFFLRSEKGALLGVRWGDFFPAVAGTNANLVTYISPDWHGFSTASAYGVDDFRDVALRYSGEWAKTFEVRAGIGYLKDTTERGNPALGPREPVDNEGVGGSIAFKHKPTGLNLAFNYYTESHADQCLARGAVSGECRGDDEFFYVIGGIVRDMFPLGPTSFYGEYYEGTREFNDSDPALLDALMLNPVKVVTDPDNPGPPPKRNEELEESNVTVWGFGVVQKIEDSTKPAGKKGAEAAAAGVPIMELFLGYKHYEIDVELIGRNPPTTGHNPKTFARFDVPSKKLEDFDAVMTGAIVRF